MLAPVVQTGVVDYWDDTRIVPGEKWQDEIKKALDSTKVAVLLVSQHFLASDFISRHELPPLLKAAQHEGVTVFWIYLSSCLYLQTEISKYQAAHDVDHPLDTLDRPKRQVVLTEICTKLLRIMQEPSLKLNSRPADRSASGPASPTTPRKIGKTAAKSESGTGDPTATELYNRALRLLVNENYDDALEIFDQVIELDPTLALAFYNRGLTYHLRGDAPDVAIADFKRALELGFRDAIVFRQRANSFSLKADVPTLSRIIPRRFRSIRATHRPTSIAATSTKVHCKKTWRSRITKLS
jgi:tetratricopeptide (TPR) repeat protein